MSFMGMDNFVWFQGVVEDRNDPEMLGRVRVRCIGFHNQDKNEMATDTLPWAMPIQPFTSASMQGIGQTPLGPVEGTWVVGFFRDGMDAQKPVIMGTLPGVSTDSPKGKGSAKVGFYDPNEIYPRDEKLNEPDMNRLARNGGAMTQPDYPTKVGKYPGLKGKISIPAKAHNTIVQVKLADLDKAVPIAPGGTWDEPGTPYGAQYTKNHVIESECGHIFEIDDTEGAERLNQHHASGTFEEIHPNGTRVTKIKGHDYQIVEGDRFEHIMGNHHIRIDGDLTISVGGKIYIKNGGTYDLHSGGNHVTTAPRIDLNP